MASLSMGAFGAYKHAYIKHLQEQEQEETEKPEDDESGTETVWVTKRYIPTDLRVVAPVPRHKFVAPKVLPPVNEQWMPIIEAPLKSFERRDEMMSYRSQPSTRSEEWSTLRQILPSRGEHRKSCQPNWGTSPGLPPIWLSGGVLKRFPKVNSPMARYVDSMHSSNALFVLH